MRLYTVHSTPGLFDQQDAAHEALERIARENTDALSRHPLVVFDYHGNVVSGFGLPAEP